MNSNLVLPLILLGLFLLMMAILFWPRRPDYSRDVTSTRNSYERHFGDW